MQKMVSADLTISHYYIYLGICVCTIDWNEFRLQFSY